MRPTQWQEKEMLLFSLACLLVTNDPLIYLQPQQMKKLVLLFVKKINYNKTLAVLIKKAQPVTAYMCKVIGITNCFIFQ